MPLYSMRNTDTCEEFEINLPYSELDKFLEDIAQENGSAKKKISKEALARLQELPWTGNIRELRNVVERLVILGETTISLEDVKKYADY